MVDVKVIGGFVKKEMVGLLGNGLSDEYLLMFFVR